MRSEAAMVTRRGTVRSGRRFHLDAAAVWNPDAWLSPRPGIRVREIYGADDGYRVGLVRYAAGARVPEHLHTGDEHSYVLEGSVLDGDGEYSVGDYLMRPAGSRHRVWSERGALVLTHRLGPIRFLGEWRPGGRSAAEAAVPTADRKSLLHITADSQAWEELRPGVGIQSLFEGAPGDYKSALLRYAPATAIPAHVHLGDEHIYILAGSQEDQSGLYGAGTYVFNPAGTDHKVWSEEGCLVLIHWRAPVRFL